MWGMIAGAAIITGIAAAYVTNEYRNRNNPDTKLLENTVSREEDRLFAEQERAGHIK